MNSQPKKTRTILRRVLLALSVTALAAAAYTPFHTTQAADEVLIKLGTLAPEGSVWYKAMRQMGDDWAAASGGRVKLKIYPGGVSGNEGAIVRKMRINQLQAGMITVTGLIDIERSSLSLQAPMAISSYDELDYIREKMAPTFNKRIEDKGFKVLNWGDAGWVYFFTKTPVTTPAQLKQVKLFSWEGDPPATEAFSKAGLKPVTIAVTDMLPSLQTNLIEGFPETALAALSFQWFGLAKNMLDLKWAPMVGATVISAKAWEKIPADLQPKLLAIAQKSGNDLKSQVRKLDEDAIGAMKKLGLQVNAPANLAEWKNFADSFYPLMRGSVMTADTLDQVLALHREYLKTHPGAK